MQLRRNFGHLSLSLNVLRCLHNCFGEVQPKKGKKGKKGKVWKQKNRLAQSAETDASEVAQYAAYSLRRWD